MGIGFWDRVTRRAVRSVNMAVRSAREIDVCLVTISNRIFIPSCSNDGLQAAHWRIDNENTDHQCDRVRSCKLQHRGSGQSLTYLVSLGARYIEIE